MTDQEIFKQVYPEHFSEKYKVSNHGNVRNCLANIMMKCNSMRGGYKSLSLRHENVSKSFKIHQLVAHAFVKKKKGCNVVNHKDGDKMNNLATNLEWTTIRKNCQHAKDTKISSNFERRVNQMDMDGEHIKTFKHITEASKETGAPLTSIIKACKGIYQSSGGYKWEYTDINLNDIVLSDSQLKRMKQHPDFPNYYVSEKGKVYSKNYKKYLKLHETNEGYHSVELTHHGKKQFYLVHRLVAELFIKNDNEDNDCVLHIDGSKINNDTKNLIWSHKSKIQTTIKNARNKKNLIKKKGKKKPQKETKC